MCDEEGASAPDSSLWVVGVLLGLSAAVASNLGVNVQKFSFMTEAKRRRSAMRPYTRQPLWILGLFFVIFGSLGDFIALGFAPQTLVIPIGGFTLVANLFFAHLWLKEKLGHRDLWSTLLIVIGVVLVAMFAEKGSSCHSLGQLVDYYFEVGFILYTIGVMATLISLHFFSKHMERIFAAVGATNPKYTKWKMLHPVSYPAMSGICGGQSVLFAKSTAELVKDTLRGNNQFLYPGAYAIILVMFVFIFAQIHMLSKGLQWFDAIFIVPVFQCFFIASSVVGGVVYFKETKNLGPGQFAGFLSGLCVLLSGVYGMALRDMNPMKPVQRFRSAGHSVMFMMKVSKKAGLEWDHTAGHPNPTDPNGRTAPRRVSRRDASGPIPNPNGRRRSSSVATVVFVPATPPKKLRSVERAPAQDGGGSGGSGQAGEAGADNGRYEQYTAPVFPSLASAALPAIKSAVQSTVTSARVSFTRVGSGKIMRNNKVVPATASTSAHAETKKEGEMARRFLSDAQASITEVKIITSDEQEQMKMDNVGASSTAWGGDNSTNHAKR